MSKIQTFKIAEITLLSIEEYEQYKPLIPCIDADWWLRSPGANIFDAACVFYNDFVHEDGEHVGCEEMGVRPALRVNVSGFSDFQPGDKVKPLAQFFGLKWTVLDVKENQVYILADDIIALRRFDPKSNSWESSELKAWLKNWLEDMCQKSP